MDDRLQCSDHIVPCDDDLMVIAVDIVRDLAGIFQIDGIHIHSDGKCLQRPAQHLCRGSADQGRIQAARQQEADWRVRVKALGDPPQKTVVDLPADLLHIILHVMVRLRRIMVADKCAVLIIMSRRERAYLPADRHQHLRLGGKYDRAVFIISVVQRPDPDGVARRDEGTFLRVIEDQGEFRIKKREHAASQPLVQRQQDLAVTVALKPVSQ